MDGTAVALGETSLEIPSGWAPSVTDETLVRQVWLPDKNERKESLAIRVVDRDLARSVDDITAAAVVAQGQLSSARIMRQELITSQAGAPGIWIDTIYQPPNAAGEYARTHVVL